jgi:hypothetical protein
MLRREAAAGYPQRYCTFADGCCAADEAMAPENGRTLGSLANSNAELVIPPQIAEAAKNSAGYRRAPVQVPSSAVVGELVRAITSRSWWRLATPSLG